MWLRPVPSQSITGNQRIREVLENRSTDHAAVVSNLDFLTNGAPRLCVTSIVVHNSIEAEHAPMRGEVVARGDVVDIEHRLVAPDTASIAGDGGSNALGVHNPFS